MKRMRMPSNSVNKPAHIYAYALCSLLVFGFLAWRHAGVEMIMNDSASYIYFHASRPIGYPVFLATLRTIGVPYDKIPLVQLALLILAFAALSLEISRYFRSPLWGAVLFVLLCANAKLTILAAWLYTEAISVVFLCLLMVAAMRFWRAPSLPLGFAKSMLIGVLVTLKPVFVVFFALDVGLIALTRGVSIRDRGVGVLVAGALVGAAWMASPIAHKAMGGVVYESSPLSRGLFQKAIFIEPRDDARARTCVGEDVYAIIGRTRQYVSEAPPPYQEALREIMSDITRFDVVIPLLAQQHDYVSESQADTELKCYAFAVIGADPWAYVSNNVRDFSYFLVNAPLVADREGFSRYLREHPFPAMPNPPHPREWRDMAAKLKAEFHREFEPAADFAKTQSMSSSESAGRWGPLKNVFRDILFGSLQCAFVIAIGIVAWAKMWGRQGMHDAYLPILTGLGVNMALFVTSNIEFPLSRYSIVFWPMVCCCALMVLKCLYSAIRV